MRYYKSLESLTQQRLHQKDITIQFLDRAFQKCKETDSLNSEVIKNSDKIIKNLNTDIRAKRQEVKKLKLQKLGLGLTTPVVAVLSFLLGWYIPH